MAVASPRDGVMIPRYASGSGWGAANNASGAYSTVAGGVGNTASGKYSTVAGGSGNTASGTDRVAMGNHANAEAHGCFVFSDSVSANATNCSTNTFVARATGGVTFMTSGTMQSNYNGLFVPAGDAANDPGESQQANLGH